MASELVSEWAWVSAKRLETDSVSASDLHSLEDLATESALRSDLH